MSVAGGEWAWERESMGRGDGQAAAFRYRRPGDGCLLGVFSSLGYAHAVAANAEHAQCDRHAHGDGADEEDPGDDGVTHCRGG